MATIVDSNVIIDVLEPNSTWGGWAKRSIGEALSYGPLVFNVVIAAEVAHAFRSRERFDAVFPAALWTFEDVPRDAARVAGWAHRDYRANGGTRDQTLPDFLIGAHAAISGHRLLTRNTRRYRSYFPDVELFSPETHP